MIDVNAPRFPLTVHLPAELIEEVRILAREKRVAVDEVVMEACLDYIDPYSWERNYREWRKENPNEPLHEFGIDGEEFPSGNSPNG